MEDRAVDIFLILLVIAAFVLKIIGVIKCTWLEFLFPLLVLLGIGLILGIIFVIYLLINLHR